MGRANLVRVVLGVVIDHVAEIDLLLNASAAAGFGSLDSTGRRLGFVPWNIVVLLDDPHSAARIAFGNDSICEATGRFSLLTASPRNSDDPDESDSDWIVVDCSHLLKREPVMTTIQQQALVPYEEGKLDAVWLLRSGPDLLRQFMLKFAREKDLALFLELAKEPRPARPEDVAIRSSCSSLHSVGIESGISDRSGALSAFFDRRHGGRVDYHLRGASSAVAPGSDIDPAQDFFS